MVEQGPSGYSWCLSWDPGSSASWAEEPTPKAVHAMLEGAKYSAAGILALLSADGTAIDLGEYDELVFEADVPDGQKFEVYVGHYTYGCTYKLTGKGDTTHTIDLAEPDWCQPTKCDHKLLASSVAFISSWEFGGEFELTVKSLSLETTSGGTGKVSALQGATGPGGHCWFVSAWDNPNSTVSWVDAPSSESVHAKGTSGAEETSALAFDLEDAPVDLTKLQGFEFEAVMDAEPFVSVDFISDADAPAGCSFNVYGEEERFTYSLDLADPTSC